MMGPQTIIPCMGGWCQHRDKCSHHTAPTTRQEPAERLCDRGRERIMFFSPGPTFQAMTLPSQQVGE